MYRHDNVTGGARETRGLLSGLIGVLIFSFTMAASRVAAPVLGGTFVGFGRSAIAGGVALAWLLARDRRRPERSAWPGLGVVTVGAVFGFPLLASMGMAHVSAVHGMVMTAFIPGMTALAAVLRDGERPSARWWAWTFAGAGIVTAWAWPRGGGALEPADALLLGAMACSAVAYAEGGRLARTMGGLRVMAWALVLGLPVTLPAALWTAPAPGAPLLAWAALGWLGLFSSFIGFGFWYRGLAEGGIARVGQVQLTQPLLGLGWAALLLGEPVGPGAVVTAIAVAACVAGGVRERTGFARAA